MNKHIVAIVLCFIAFKNASAQTEKGSQNLGASFGISTTTYTTEGYDSKTKGTSYNISPNYSYFIADKLDIGTSLGFNRVVSTVKNSNPTNIKQINRELSASVFLRKYFLYNNKIGIRTGPYFTYTHNKSGTTNADAIYNSNYKSNYYRGGVNLDFVYYPTTNIGLAAGIADISYIHEKAEASNSLGAANSNTFNLRFMDNLSLSIFYVFGK
ncbi:hypothetical protein GCM10023149_31740 [Mucilaginibacter gynuensis]|uniref:Outer membrane protein beta-barrel domain-containing protein n=1 Tax=Mucilaginibacter gynuensis TaxID=1302236 RepID=A0ABP8GP75_9SPHI